MYRTFLVLGTLWGLSGISQGVEPPQPNMVLFLIDDLGWKDLGCQGSTYYRTPNIDRMASSGVRFTDAYAACAVCSPTRAAVLTGKYPARLMLTDWLPSGRWNPQAKLREGRFLRGLPVEEFTLAEALRPPVIAQRVSASGISAASRFPCPSIMVLTSTLQAMHTALRATTSFPMQAIGKSPPPTSGRFGMCCPMARKANTSPIGLPTRP